MVARDKVPQTKEKDFDMVEPSVGYSDMDDEIKDIAYEVCREAYSKCPACSDSCRNAT
jgi:hypothetical protein